MHPVVELHRPFRVGERILEIAQTINRRAHQYPNVHERFRAQAIRLPTQDVVANFEDVPMAAIAV